MVKILGINVKIIIAILYVYYCEINAELQTLDPWSSYSETESVRRAQTTKKKYISEWKNEKGELRHSKGHTEPAKFTRSVRADIKLSPPKHYPRRGSSHVEPILRNFEDSSSDSDFEKDENRDRHKYSIKDQNGDRFYYSDDDDKMDKKKNYKKDNQSPTINKDKSYNRNRNPTTSKDINTNESHNKNRGSIRNKENLNDIDKKKNHMKEKSLNKNKIEYTDISEDMDTSNENEESYENYHTTKEYPRKERYNEKSRGRKNKIGGPMRIPKLNPEPLQGRILELEKTTKKSTRHHHRSKLRSQTPTEEGIQSTRLTPMYLMNQQGDEREGPDGGNPTFLSPYSIASQLTRIMAEFPEANATIESLGRTVEYNEIILLRVTEKKSASGKYFRASKTKYVDDAPEKKIIFIVHGLSVMGITELECLSSENGLKILLSYYFAYLPKFDIFIIPMANPDGISAVHALSPWNKNASPQEACGGVTLDRNFDVAWNATHQISSCSQLYPGPAPFSEIETRVIRDILHYYGHKIVAFIHVHSGTYTNTVFKGDAILYPRGYSDSQSDDDKYVDLKAEIDDSMKNASFQVLSVAVETLHNWYGRVTGASVDYASTIYGIPYALEFVMQLYEGGDEYDTMANYALKEIWSRLIDTTFDEIWKSFQIQPTA